MPNCKDCHWISEGYPHNGISGYCCIKDDYVRENDSCGFWKNRCRIDGMTGEELPELEKPPVREKKI